LRRGWRRAEIRRREAFFAFELEFEEFEPGILSAAGEETVIFDDQ